LFILVIRRAVSRAITCNRNPRQWQTIYGSSSGARGAGGADGMVLIG